MNFIASLQEVFPVIGRDIKNILLAMGNVDNLSTTSREIVGAINELVVKLDSKTSIEDGSISGDSVTYSIDKILRLVKDAKDEIRGNVSSEYDTLAKLADKIVELVNAGASTDRTTLIAGSKPTMGISVGSTQEEFNNAVDNALAVLMTGKANVNLDNVAYNPIPDWSTLLDNNTNF